MARITVLGGGRVGRTIAMDLARDHDVTVADLSEEALQSIGRLGGIQTIRANLAMKEEIAQVVASADLVVGAVPGHMGFETVRAVLEAGRPIVDISFFDEDPFHLDALARERGLVALIDCGIAPGYGNILLGHLERTMERIDRFDCAVGGLPVVRSWPFEYRAVFSPLDVIEEYTRPARLMVGGKVVTRPALSGLEPVEFEEIGTLEAFLTDGLRTLLVTMDIPEMRERTLRYPGHADRMRMLRETGSFSKEPVAIGESTVRPLDLTAHLLQDAWRMEPGEEDLTVMRLEVEGIDGGRAVRRVWELLDRYDPETGTTSMARTTGYTCTGAVRAVLEGLYNRPGISPPEYLGREPGCFEAVTTHLAERGVVFRER